MNFDLHLLKSVPSPALIVDLDAAAENVRRMIEMAGGPERLRPHVKTHKMTELVRLQVAAGIRRFKCATVAEAEMTAAAGAEDILLAMAPSGPNCHRLIELHQRFPRVSWRTIGDDVVALKDLSACAAAAGTEVEVLLDLNVGQNRTGVLPGRDALDITRFITQTQGLRFGGLHAYDGHIHQSDCHERLAACASSWSEVEKMIDLMAVNGFPPPRRIVVGGTPSFPFHARNPSVECSPGTSVLWDAGYATRFPDLKFLHAAWLLARVISRPGPDRICIDLGHKSVASEMAHPRVLFPQLPEARPVMHSEEHLVLENVCAADWPPGSCLSGIPWHICPTVALHSGCTVLQHGAIGGEWQVTARVRKLTI